jgi:hypothetical protein
MYVDIFLICCCCAHLFIAATDGHILCFGVCSIASVLRLLLAGVPPKGKSTNVLMGMTVGNETLLQLLLLKTE